MQSLISPVGHFAKKVRAITGAVASTGTRQRYCDSERSGGSNAFIAQLAELCEGETEMKRRAAIGRVMVGIGIAVAVAVAWRAWNVPDVEETKTSRVCCAGNFMFIIPPPIGHFRMIP
jgi:hypothetical protein